ncbi:SdpI family protein [Nocardiopsis quinghaiensis]|uniref:SdpI family protein n=1 Tax=Nocardiopsis quinghaiensis TaxID=464995 RepID=UPI00123ABDCE|nr:SdpI family protein [Nocardiopsis quinghaiensis]
MEEAVGLLVLAFGLIVAAGAVHHVRNSAAGGALERNVLIGLRTRATLASDRAWREGHLAAVPWLTATVRVGYVAGVVAVVSVLASMAVEALLPVVWIVAVAGYTASTACLVTGTVKAHRAAEAFGPSPR